MTVLEEPRRENRALMFLGHYSTHMILGAWPLQVANDAVLRSVWMLDDVASWTWVGAVAVVVLCSGHHDERLCERCIAAVPLDPKKEVRRWLPALRLAHMKRTTLALWALIIPWQAVMIIVRDDHTWWACAGGAVVITVVAAVYGAVWRHRRLYPWCPFCDWGGGGEHEAVPAPEPDPAAAL